MPFLFDVPDEKKLRVIIDTDAACEADDPFAIVQALLSPKLIVKGINAAHFNEAGSVQKSLQEIHTILDAMKKDVPAFLGAEDPLPAEAAKAGFSPREVSPASDFIIEEALRDDPHPLYILVQGAITNVAAAFLKCPEIINRVTVIWIGTHGAGNVQAPFREFNAGNDVTAANIILSSGTDLWLVPSTVYTTVLIGLAEIQTRIRPCGEIGRHLFDNMVAYNMSRFAGWTKGESWSLGDSPAPMLAINPDCGDFTIEEAPEVLPDTSSRIKPGNPRIRVYSRVDTRYLLEDLIAKLQIFTIE